MAILNRISNGIDIGLIAKGSIISLSIPFLLIHKSRNHKSCFEALDWLFLLPCRLFGGHPLKAGFCLINAAMETSASSCSPTQASAAPHDIPFLAGFRKYSLINGD
jgi:hypothetical protein